jgi:hypothetical protein
MRTKTSLRQCLKDVLVGQWVPTFCEPQDRIYDSIKLPKGSIKKFIGRELSWDDEPVELK